MRIIIMTSIRIDDTQLPPPQGFSVWRQGPSILHLQAFLGRVCLGGGWEPFQVALVLLLATLAGAMLLQGVDSNEKRSQAFLG